MLSKPVLFNLAINFQRVTDIDRIAIFDEFLGVSPSGGSIYSLGLRDRVSSSRELPPINLLPLFINIFIFLFLSLDCSKAETMRFSCFSLKFVPHLYPLPTPRGG